MNYAIGACSLKVTFLDGYEGFSTNNPNCRCISLGNDLTAAYTISKCYLRIIHDQEQVRISSISDSVTIQIDYSIYTAGLILSRSSAPGASNINYAGIRIITESGSTTDCINYVGVTIGDIIDDCNGLAISAGLECIHQVCVLGFADLCDVRLRRLNQRIHTVCILYLIAGNTGNNVQTLSGN